MLLFGFMLLEWTDDKHGSVLGFLLQTWFGLGPNEKGKNQVDKRVFENKK